MNTLLNILALLMLVFHPSKTDVAELSELIDQIKSKVQEVQGNKSTYEQQITSSGIGVLDYKVIATNSKGKSEISTYQFNLADVDPYAVREETDGDIILVTMSIANKQDLVKTTEDGEPGNYESEVALMAKDVDNARELVALIKEAIPLAKEKNESRLDVNSYDDMVSWLTANVKDVHIGDDAYQQQIEKGAYEGSLIFTKVASDGKSSEEEWYAFNLADINPNSIQFEISGEEMGVNFETQRKQKIIQYRKKEEAESFQNEVTIMANDVESARDLRTVLSMAVAAAGEQLKDAMPTYSSETEALNATAEYLGKVSYGDNEIEQSLEASCVTNVLVVDKDPKKTDEYKYTFNLMDINPKVVDYATSGEKMYLKLATKEEKDLIKTYENGKFEGFTDGFQLYVEDIEEARRLKDALVQSIEYCTNSYQQPYPDNQEGITRWIMESIRDVTIGETTYKQDLDPVVDGNFEKVRLMKTEIDSKGGTEEVYEFSLSDINPRSIDYDISKDELSIVLETNYQDDIIKYYKDGEIQNYVSTVEIVFDDIETARNVKEGLIKVTEEFEAR